MSPIDSMQQPPDQPDTEQVPDWTADPRFGHDDIRTGTIDQLRELVLRRIREVTGALGSPELEGQVFRYGRDYHRLGEALGDWSACEQDPRYHVRPRLDAILGAGWSDVDDAEPYVDPVDDLIYPQESAGEAAARALPWILRDRSTPLAELLGEDDVEPVYRVADIWPSGGKIVLSAPQKAGKSTAVGNILRALADGTPVFGDADGRGGFPVVPLRGGETIFLADFELSRGMLRRWLGDQDVTNVDRIHVESFRGRAWDVRDDEVRAVWAAYLRDRRTRVIVVDPLAPVLAALDIDELSNKGVGRFLHALDVLVAESGASELLVVHHTGHVGERSRGAAVLRGWPDAEWHLIVQRPGDGREPEADAPRFFRAAGRDVAVAETALEYDVAARRLHLSAGNRDTFTLDRHAGAVTAIVASSPGLGRNRLEELVRADVQLSQKAARDVIRSLTHAGELHTHPGPNRRTLHYPGSSCTDCHQAVAA